MRLRSRAATDHYFHDQLVNWIWPKPKYVQIIIIEDWDNENILMFEKQEDKIILNLST